MKQRAITLLVVVCAATLTGCISPRTSGIMVEKGRLHVEDPAFAANIELIGDADACEKTPEGFLHAQATVKNTNREDFYCQYRFEWRGKNGMMQTQAPTPWRPKVLHGRETVELEAVSPIQGTEDFRLVVRRLD